MTRVLEKALCSTPATWIYLSMLAGTTAVLTVSSVRTDDRLLLALSTNLDQLARVPVRVLVGSAFWVGDWHSFLLWALLLAAVMVPMERRFGWRRTTTVFLFGHLGATLLVAAGLWIGLLLDAVDPGVAGARDVGASYGFLAVAGVATLLLPSRHRRLYAVALTAYVVLGAVLSHTFTDFGHLLAVAIGFTCVPLISGTLHREVPRSHTAQLGSAAEAR